MMSDAEHIHTEHGSDEADDAQAAATEFITGRRGIAIVFHVHPDGAGKIATDVGCDGRGPDDKRFPDMLRAMLITAVESLVDHHFRPMCTADEVASSETQN